MRFDLIVAGGGVVGASLVRALRGLSIALVDARSSDLAAAAPDGAGWDARVYALSPGNVGFLRELKVWQEIPPERLTPVYGMQVHGDRPASAIGFDAYRAGVPELAWIVEDRALQSALWQTLRSQDGCTNFPAARGVQLELDATAGVRLELQDGRSLESSLIVGADGAHSFVREAAGIAVTARQYGQTAVVANFRCERAHGNIARQWFQGGPVLALLPLPGERVSMVWSLPDVDAGRLQGLEPMAFAREVELASAGALGALEVLTPPQSFALRRFTASRLVQPHLALVGDAAHVVHPLAGQGLNLGLQDVRVLAETLLGRESVRGLGDLRLLRRYERARAEDILLTGATMHGLHALFGAPASGWASLRNLGLNFSDRLPVLKNLLLRHALR
jgi:2-octaprenylphenol hydroxylase